MNILDMRFPYCNCSKGFSTKFTIHWGAARYPQNGMVEGEGQHYQAESLGISSYREGAGNAESAETTRKVFSISLSSVSGTGLDGMGASSRQLPRRETGGVKSVLPPSLKEATLFGEPAGCGDTLRASSTTPFSKEFGGTRLIAVPNGNKLED